MNRLIQEMVEDKNSAEPYSKLLKMTGRGFLSVFRDYRFQISGNMQGVTDLASNTGNPLVEILQIGGKSVKAWLSLAVLEVLNKYYNRDSDLGLLKFSDEYLSKLDLKIVFNDPKMVDLLPEDEQLISEFLDYVVKCYEPRLGKSVDERFEAYNLVIKKDNSSLDLYKNKVTIWYKGNSISLEGDIRHRGHMHYFILDMAIQILSGGDYPPECSSLVKEYREEFKKHTLSHILKDEPFITVGIQKKMDDPHRRGEVLYYPEKGIVFVQGCYIMINYEPIEVKSLDNIKDDFLEYTVDKDVVALLICKKEVVIVKFNTFKNALVIYVQEYGSDSLNYRGTPEELV